MPAKFRRLLSFIRSDKGSTAVLLGIAAVPVVVAGAVAVEFAGISRAKIELQALTDAAALAAANSYAGGGDDYEQIARDYIDNNKSEGPFADLAISPEVTPDTDAQTMTVEATVDLPRMMGSVLGATHTEIDVTSTVSLPVFSEYNKGEIVLVMDYSSSMSDKVNGTKKYYTMRDETVDLINDLTQDGDNTDVKIGLVPFSDMVRVTMPKNYFTGQTSGSSWTQCVADRKYPHNLAATTPSTSTSSNTTKFISEGSCSTYSTLYLNVRDLTNSHSPTISQIRSMKPSGMTHIALGMEWAYHLLSPNAPYTTASSFNTDGVLKAVVLLTDGRQTAGGWGPGNLSYGRTPEQAEENLEQICSNLKAEGVRVITVSFDLDDTMEADTETRLRECSGDINEPDGTYYFNTDTNDELANAFGVIKNELARNMYLSK